MTSAELVTAMSAAGAPMEAIVIALRALDEKDAEIKARDAAAAEKRAKDAERKRLARGGTAKDEVSTECPRTIAGQSTERPQTSPEVSPNDIYSNPLPNPSGAKAPSAALAERVVEAWNEGPGAAGATTAKPLNADRRKALSLRVREHGEEAVFEAIRHLGQSAWHCGQNDRGWKANLGWLLKSPECFQKALEMEPARSAAPLNGTLASLAEQASRYRDHGRHAN